MNKWDDYIIYGGEMPIIDLELCEEIEYYNEILGPEDEA